jgi:hypothetical protein
MSLSHDPACRLCRLMFCITMGLAWAGAPQSRAMATPQAPGAAGPSPEVRLAQVQNSLRAMEDALKQLPRDTFDVQAIVTETGNDPARILQWVRDHTSWAPYRGLLREDIGVLMDRTGNSLDRAYLLASLLKAAGREARLAHAQLDAHLAQSLIARVRLEPAARNAPSPAPGDSFAATARKYQIDEAAARKKLDEYAVQFSAVRQKVDQRASEQAPLVSSQIGKPREMADERGKAVEALQDHWWVQWHDGGNWVDLDPLLPDARPGATVAASQQTFDPNAIPEDLRQQVVIRAVIERWQDKKPGEVAVLEHAFRPAEVLGKQIRFGNYPMSWPGDFNPADPRDLESRLKAAVLAQHEWVPTLMVGTQPLMQGSFSDAGQINPRPNFAAAAGDGKSVAGAGQGVLDAFGGNSAPPAPSGAVTAEWLEYEIRVPGQAPRKIRRQIFDLIGPGARAAGSAAQPDLSEAQRLSRGLELFSETDILVCGCQLSGDYLTGRGLSAMLANQKMILATMGNDPAMADPKARRKAVEEMKPMPGELEELAYSRLKLGRYRDAVFANQPDILTRHVRVHADAAGHLMGCKAFDIVANEVGVRPGSKSDAFAVRLQQGVVDTNLESALLSGCGLLHSAAETFAASGNDPRQWAVLRDPHDPALTQLAVSSDVKARIASDLSSGAIVLVPRNPTANNPSWWRIDPATGTALGIGENGWGQTIAEYAFLMFVTFCVAFVYCEFSLSRDEPNASAKDVFNTCILLALAAACIAVAAMALMEGLNVAAASNAMNYGSTLPALGGMGAGL